MSYTKPFKVLDSIINDIESDIKKFVNNPEKDFTRKRKLDFKTMIKLMISMEGGSIQKELFEYFKYDVATATTPAFIQQREKLKPQVFKEIFTQLNNSFPRDNKYQGYTLLSIDGSKVTYTLNELEPDCIVRNNEGSRAVSLVNLNAMYDLLENRYVDCIVQPIRNLNERSAAIEMVDRYKTDDKPLFILDRGYEFYNLFAHIDNNNQSYLCRVKDIHSNGILKSFDLDDSEFDIDIKRTLTRRNTKFIKKNTNIYKFMPQNQNFDFFDNFESEYEMEFRVVRFKINDDSYESVITNLTREEFDNDKIQELYGLRWGIETSFRDLKYSVGMMSFHSNKKIFIEQEILASLILYNVSQISSKYIDRLDKGRLLRYQINFKAFMEFIKHHLKRKDDPLINEPPDLNIIRNRFYLPVRPNRKYKRKMNTRSNVIHPQYRIS